MTTLNKYFNTATTYKPPVNYDITLKGKIPDSFHKKVKMIIEAKGYDDPQDYINSLYNEHKELEELIIPYEILRDIDEDYYNLQGLYKDSFQSR